MNLDEILKEAEEKVQNADNESKAAKETLQKNTEEVANSTVVPVKNQVIENRQEIIAAVSAAVAEDMGTDISGIRILSFKKL